MLMIQKFTKLVEVGSEYPIVLQGLEIHPKRKQRLVFPVIFNHLNLPPQTDP